MMYGCCALALNMTFCPYLYILGFCVFTDYCATLELKSFGIHNFKPLCPWERGIIVGLQPAAATHPPGSGNSGDFNFPRCKALVNTLPPPPDAPPPPPSPSKTLLKTPQVYSVGLCIFRHIDVESKVRQLPGTAGTMLRLKPGFKLHSFP